MGLAKTVSEQVVDENDLFPKGQITQYYPYQGYGYVKDNRGKEVVFKMDEIELIGPKADKQFLAAGSRVGYDVSWTSSGLHIRKLKIY
jgi:cold shock CspA family protein